MVTPLGLSQDNLLEYSLFLFFFFFSFFFFHNMYHCMTVIVVARSAPSKSKSTDKKNNNKKPLASCIVCVYLHFNFFLNFYFLQLYCPNGSSPLENLDCFPQGKPAVTESCYPTYDAPVQAWCFSVSIIH